MTRFTRSRFLAPAVVAVAGSVLAGAVAMGHSWGDAIITEIVTLLLGICYFVLTRSDSDLGAIYGRRADERQRQVLLRASRMAFVVMISAAFLCAVITVALGDNYWQADLIGSLGGVGYLFGMMSFGAHEDDAVGIERGVMAGRSTSSQEPDTF